MDKGRHWRSGLVILTSIPGQANATYSLKEGNFTLTGLGLGTWNLILLPEAVFEFGVTVNKIN